MLVWKHVNALRNPGQELNIFEKKMLQETFRTAKVVYCATTSDTQQVYVIGEFPGLAFVAMALDVGSSRSIIAVVKERKLLIYLDVSTMQSHFHGGVHTNEEQAFKQLRKKMRYALFSIPSPHFSYQLNHVLKREIVNDELIERIRQASTQYVRVISQFGFFS